jgi:hypothetical protein
MVGTAGSAPVVGREIEDHSAGEALLLDPLRLERHAALIFVAEPLTSFVHVRYLRLVVPFQSVSAYSASLLFADLSKSFHTATMKVSYRLTLLYDTLLPNLESPIAGAYTPCK